MITVKLFAMLKERAGRDELTIESTMMTVEALLSSVASQHPELADFIQNNRVLVSVNQEFAHPHTEVRDGDEVAFMPPFSGGTDVPVAKTRRF